MENKRSNGNLLIFCIMGVIFVVFGIFLFASPQRSAPLILISAVDVLFGAALIVGAISSSRNGGTKPIDDYSNVQDSENDSTPEETPVSVSEESYFDDDLDSVSSVSDPAELAARENDLRIAAKRASEEATHAKKVATAAVEEAKQAEAELRQAEDELSNLSPSEQRAAMRHIDMLAQRAAEKSEIAVNQAKRAKLAIRNAREAAELHSMAMDAAASALSGEDEFAEFD